ncbi:hypothetical protein [Paraburkholderia xenovorans]|uniref:hypothetical protein n=1 Tax=Paraburkholderia xenovorans TaxID=36873 RepID=UPI0038BCFB70
MNTQIPRFAAPSRVLHWLMAALILVMLSLRSGAVSRIDPARRLAREHGLVAHA